MCGFQMYTSSMQCWFSRLFVYSSHWCVEMPVCLALSLLIAVYRACWPSMSETSSVSCLNCSVSCFTCWRERRQKTLPWQPSGEWVSGLYTWLGLFQLHEWPRLTCIICFQCSWSYVSSVVHITVLWAVNVTSYLTGAGFANSHQLHVSAVSVRTTM